MVDNRRDRRYRGELLVSVLSRRHAAQVRTENVSVRGAYVKMDEPPPVRSLLHLEVHLPDGAILRPHALVVYRRTRDERGGPGVGLQFFGFAGTERRQWHAFIEQLAEREPVLHASVPPPS